MLIPRRERLPNDVLRREDLPATFAMTDQIGGLLDAPQITAIHITDDYNAAISKVGHDRVLYIGAIMWAALESDQKIALVAHELGHLVNDDPTRYGLLAAALNTLEGWHDMFLPSGLVDEYGNPLYDGGGDVIGNLITGALRTVIELIWSGLERLTYFAQQRAEYLANALSAEIAGRAALVSFLKQIEFADRMEPVIAGFGNLRLPKGMDMIRSLADATVNISAQDRDAALARMRDTGHAVDSTHPPTAFRIAFLQTIPDMPGKLLASDVDFAPIDAELDPPFACVGNRIAASLTRQ